MILRIKTKWLWVSRFFAAALIVGGLGGTLISILTTYPLSLHNWIKLFSAAALAALYFFTAVIGVALWKNKNYAKTWAAILFALQVPIFSSPSLSYNGSRAWPLSVSVATETTIGSLS